MNHQDIIGNWQNRTRKKLAELDAFIDNDSEHNHKVETLKKETENVFDKIDCLQCAQCCTTTPPIFTNKDVKRISRHLGMTPKNFKRTYTIEDIDGTLVGIKVPCSFLDEQNRCRIYEVRPQACREFPHTDDPQFFSHSLINKANIRLCPAAFVVVQNVLNRIERED